MQITPICTSQKLGRLFRYPLFLPYTNLECYSDILFSKQALNQECYLDILYFYLAKIRTIIQIYFVST